VITHRLRTTAINKRLPAFSNFEMHADVTGYPEAEVQLLTSTAWNYRSATSRVSIVIFWILLSPCIDTFKVSTSPKRSPGPGGSRSRSCVGCFRHNERSIVEPAPTNQAQMNDSDEFLLLISGNKRCHISSNAAIALHKASTVEWLSGELRLSKTIHVFFIFLTGNASIKEMRILHTDGKV